MEYKIKEQRHAGYVTVGDKLELYNCEDHHMNGDYAVLMVEESGEITLGGLGKKSGYVTVVCMQTD